MLSGSTESDPLKLEQDVLDATTLAFGAGNDTSDPTGKATNEDSQLEEFVATTE